MAETRQRTYQDLLNDVAACARDDFEAAVEDGALDIWHADDWTYETAHGIADSTVPVYTSELLRMALDKLWLATDVCELATTLPSEEMTPAKVIKCNIYEDLYEHVVNVLYDLIECAKDAAKDAADDVDEDE